MEPTERDADDLWRWIGATSIRPPYTFTVAVEGDGLHVTTDADPRALHDFTPRWNGFGVKWTFADGQSQDGGTNAKG